MGYSDRTILLQNPREDNIFKGICLSTIILMATRSLLGLVTARVILEFLLELVQYQWENIKTFKI